MPSEEDSHSVPGPRIGSLLQFVYPQRLLCAMMHGATRVRFRPWKSWQIRWFVRRYGVDMSEALHPDAAAYPDFNHFFTRALRPGVRPVDPSEDAVVSPADGSLGQLGPVRDDVLVQAKGLEYSLRGLLGGDETRSAAFEGGSFLTVYLAPRNYHRVHMPVAGVLRETVHVPGRFFSVGTEATQRIPNLFTRNARVVSLFDHARGPLAIVMVGALFVGGIEQAWAEPGRSPRRRRLEVRDYRSRATPLSLRKADEMGRFNMGSTVVAVFGPGFGLRWAPDLVDGRTMRVGERVATIGPGT